MRFHSRAQCALLALALAALAGFVATTALRPLDNNDVWIHLTTGRLILEEGRIPERDPYSFTAPNARYVPHEWAAASLYALGERAAGLPGVVAVGKVLPALLALAALLAAVAAAGAPWGLALPYGVLALTIYHRRILARPELWALVPLLLALALLLRDREHARRQRRTRALYALVPLQVLWANLHGSFVLGIALVLAFAAAEGAERLLEPRSGRRPRALRAVAGGALVLLAALLASRAPAAFGLAGAGLALLLALFLALDARWPLVRTAPSGAGPQGLGRLLGLAALLVAASFLNPLGPELLTFPFEFTAGKNAVTTTVNEWSALLEADHLLASLRLPAYAAFVGLALAALAGAAARDRLDWLAVVLLAGFLLALPLRHVRWIGIGALVAVPVLGAQLDAARNAPRTGSAAQRNVARGLGAAALACGLVALGLVLRAPADPAYAAAFALAVLAPSVALAIALRAGRSTALGTAAAAACAALLAGVGLLHGVPRFAGGETSAWIGPGPRSVGPSREGNQAVAFLRREELAGRLFTEYEWAGYAIHELWPAVRVFIDSRSEVYGPELLREYGRAKARPEAARRVLDRRGASLVLVRHRPFPSRLRSNPGLLRAVSEDPAWGLLYVDDHAILYARRGAIDAGPGYLEGFDPLHFDLAAARAEPEALELPLRKALARAPHSAFLRFAWASTLRARGRLREALDELERGWRANPDYAAGAQLAGEIARELGRLPEARRWFQRAAGAAPEWERPRAALEALAG